MTDFLNSLKADLLNRQVLPFLALAVVALAGALVYAVIERRLDRRCLQAAGPAAHAPAAVPPIAVSQAPANTKQAVAETTSGAAQQRGGPTRNPFTPLPAAKTASTSTKPAASKASGSSTPGAGGTTPAAPKETTPAKPKKVYVHYHVTAQLGVVPPSAEGAPPQPAQLKTYKDMALDEPLPARPIHSSSSLVWCCAPARTRCSRLTGAAILHGSATCLPSADAMPGDRAAGRPVRDARIRGSERHPRDLRTEARHHHQEREHRVDRSCPHRLHAVFEGRARTAAP